MLSEDLHLSDKHLSDQEMLLAADGELSTRRAAQVHSHLAECWAVALGWQKSKRRLPISRELTDRLSIRNYLPSPDRVHY